MRAEGVDVISLGIGDPDLPTPPAVVEALQRAVERPETHQYPSNSGLERLPRGRRELLRRALRRRRRPGDGGDPRPRRQGGGRARRARLPRPRRRRPRARPRLPAVHVGPRLRRRGGALSTAPRGERLHARPGCDSAGDGVERPTSSTSTTPTIRPGPSSPTASSSGQSPSPASTTWSRSTTPPTRRSPSTATGRRASSATPGAKEVGAEIFSLSKGWNMTGWRVGWIAGNAEVVERYRQLKTNLDSGMFDALQLAGVAALTEARDVPAGDVGDLPPPPRPDDRRAHSERDRRGAHRAPPRTSGSACPRATTRRASPSSSSSRRRSSSRRGRRSDPPARATSASR